MSNFKVDRAMQKAPKSAGLGLYGGGFGDAVGNWCATHYSPIRIRAQRLNWNAGGGLHVGRLVCRHFSRFQPVLNVLSENWSADRFGQLCGAVFELLKRLFDASLLIHFPLSLQSSLQFTRKLNCAQVLQNDLP